MAGLLQVEVVSADRLVWSGQATEVRARTAEGDIGILADHAPVLSVLVTDVVTVQQENGDTWVGAVSSGFLSVAGNRVSVLAEYAQDGREIELAAAERELELAESASDEDDRAREVVRLTQARVKAARGVR
jgi:F-type H+-transporting ATPase subunit epsilon